MSSFEEAAKPQGTSPARNGATMNEVENGRVTTEEEGGKRTDERSKEYAPVGRIVGRVIEVAIVTVVITGVWGLFSLPTVFYFMNNAGNSNSSSQSCTSEVYTGQFCRDALLSRQQCIPGRENTTEVHIQSQLLGGLSQTQIESFLENFQSFLQFEPSPECFEMLVPFLCSNIFAPCSDTGQLHLPFEQECVSLRDGICMQEWQEIISLQQGLAFLPECGTLPGSSGSSLCQSIQTTTGPIETQNTSNRTTPITPNSKLGSQPSALNITCSPDFYLDTDAGFCKPECGHWKPFPDDVVLADTVLVIMSSAMGIAGGILIVTLSMVKYRHMFKFPAILILYQSTNLALFLLVELIGYMDTQTFLCPSRDATESFTGSTHYCTLFGITLYYLLNQALIFWITHIVSVLWLVAFPIKAKHLESSGRYKTIHITIVAAALILPIGCVAAPLGTGGFQPFYYPSTCVAKNSDVSYYAFVLPVSVQSAIGVSLITLLFWVLIRRKWKDILLGKYAKKQRKGDFLKVGQTLPVIPTTAVIKVLVSFLCYTTFNILGIASGASLFRVQSQYAEELAEYFICESSGISADRICEKTYEALYSPIPSSMSLFLSGILYPSVNLLYILNLKELHTCVKSRISSTLTHSKAITSD